MPHILKETGTLSWECKASKAWKAERQAYKTLPKSLVKKFRNRKNLRISSRVKQTVDGDELNKQSVSEKYAATLRMN